jgi:hypothetical protein
MAYAGGTEPVNYTLKDTITVSGAGLLLQVSSVANKVDLTASAASDVAFLVSADESSRDAAGDLETASATVAAYPLGSVFLIQSEALTWAFGDLAYASGSGLADKTSGSQKLIGVYVGSGETATSGDQVPINTASAVNA